MKYNLTLNGEFICSYTSEYDAEQGMFSHVIELNEWGNIPVHLLEEED